MKLVHYSDHRIDELWSGQPLSELGFKPHGLWVSDDDCEDNWRNWCEVEGFREEGLVYAHEIVLAKSAKVLVVSGEYAIDTFTVKFAKPGTLEHDIWQIDWLKVMAKYDGIVITPYVWSRRLEVSWYYPWDCASGCIWNPDVLEIKSVTETGIKEAVKK